MTNEQLLKAALKDAVTRMHGETAEHAYTTWARGSAGFFAIFGDNEYEVLVVHCKRARPAKEAADVNRI